MAGAAKADLLADLRAAVERGIAEGRTLETFRKDFREIVKKYGWTGWTGEGTAEGEAWRTRVIFETNLRTSYAAGRWRQLTDPALLTERPYWRYVHNDLVLSPRPHHKAWGDARLTLRHDHPFWQTHFPPNGWGCRCRVVAERAPREGDATEPPAGWNTAEAKTGAPAGIDKGWAYAPGANATTPLMDLVGQKLLNLDAPVGAAMWEALGPALKMERELSWWQTLSEWLADPLPRGRTVILGALSPSVLAWLKAKQKPAPLTAEIAVRDNLPLGAKQRRHEADQNGLTEAEWRTLPAQILRPGAIYLDSRSGKLIFVIEEIGPAKIAVEFNPSKLKKSDFNLVESAFRVSDEAIAGAVKSGEWTPVEVHGRRVGVEPT